MNRDKLEVIAPDPARHHDDMFDMICKVFSHPGYFHFRDHLRKGYLDGSHYDWRASRIGLVGGRIVTHWGVWGFRMRIGSATVRVGGVGAVATHGDFRKRGYMLKTGLASVEAMRDLGYDLSVLFGINDFYHRFGYVRAWPEIGYYVDTNALPRKMPGGMRLKAFRLVQRDDLDRLYNRRNAGLTGTAIRPTYSRRSGAWGEEGYLWAGPRGKVRGYVVVMPERTPTPKLFLLDSAGEPEEVMAAMGILARRNLALEARFGNMHLASPLARRLKVGPARLEMVYRSGGPLICTVNLGSCLTKMAGELSRRLRASHLAGWRGQLVVADKRQQVVLKIAGGVKVEAGAAAAPAAAKHRHAIRGGDHVAQLLIGTDEPLETARTGGMKLTGDARQLAEVLFPRQYPMLAGADRF
ncbi:MAG: GNAT family N-acetyltransferase [Phycisphaerae bacterium]